MLLSQCIRCLLYTSSLSIKALTEIIEEKEEEPDYELPESEEISTSLGSLFKNLKL